MHRAAVSSSLALVVLLATLDSGLCLNCYQCSSTTTNDCKDPFKAGDAIKSLDCKNQATQSFNTNYLSQLLPSQFFMRTQNAPSYCYKLVLESGLAIRTCAEGSSGNMNATCQMLDTTMNAVSILDSTKRLKHCSVCDKDGCNAAAGNAASLALAAGAAAVAYLAYH